MAALAVLALAAAGAAGGARAAEIEAPHVINDPHYGDALFYFFQDRYFTSVTGLMVSQHFGRVSQHVDEAEVLRGGLLLSYGMHREAGEIFARLIDKTTSQGVRDRAWFFLAKIRYQRNLNAEAEEALGRIGNRLPPALEEERVLLLGNLLMARGDYAGAAKVLGGLTAGATDAGRYARFNLGIALIRGGDPAEGAKVLDALGKAPAENEEFRSLRDKANVALGFSSLQSERPDEARVFLQRVRLESPQANKALLGFGWAASALRLHRQALVPWTELAGRDASDAAVLESRIAVPYAYAELGAYGQSLQLYNEAIATFTSESGKLDESIAAIRAGKLLEGLVASNPGEEMGWFWTLRELPDMPHAGHLTQVLAQHEFQEAFKNYRDLRFLGGNLRAWADNLGVFGDMLANRRLAYAERLPKVLAKARESGLTVDGLQRRGATLADELARAEEAADGSAFADAKQRELTARLERVRQTLEQGGSDPEIVTARERYRLAAGALTWQLAEAYPVRVWEAKKALRTVDADLAEARRRDTALAQAQRDEPARFDAFDARIKALAPRIQALIPRIEALSGEQQRQLQGLAVAELQRQKERLAEYTVQARFAVAQLYDLAKPRRELDRAPQ